MSSAQIRKGRLRCPGILASLGFLSPAAAAGRLFLLITLTLSVARAQTIPSDAELLAGLRPCLPALAEVYALRDQGQTEEALHRLAGYLREQSACRYYFDWQRFGELFAAYCKRYPLKRSEHLRLAREQMTTYPADTEWMLPFRNLQGKEVTAYELRHLARQNKSRDIALMHHYERDTRYLHYWLAQVEDLNRAFKEGAYDQAGNAIYENLRGGMRVQNWLFAHHVFLAALEYDEQAQLLLIRTLFHHGLMLEKGTQRYRSGNHHTKGLAALFELAVLFGDFRAAEAWRAQAIAGLTRHMHEEINPDGFQFERSVHYHIGDIDNYFRVYQLAQINQIKLPEEFILRFRRMFTALAQLARPDRRLPVLQDDTDAAYSEYNEIYIPMSAGALLFGDPLFRYFAGDAIPAELYWLTRPEQQGRLLQQSGVQPEFSSLALKESGYYCMRSGWEQNDLHMVISAGLSRIKPDHQHGDMLGVVAWANGRDILPNYQVSYNTPEYPFWKNSWVKNVALADSIPLGRKWIPNEGGSGFGKWGVLPTPQVLEWRTAPEFDYFRGTHDSYDSLGIHYFREVLFIKSGFWIIRDHFRSEGIHSWQQMWQGHYQRQNARCVVAQFADGSGLEIIQLDAPADTILFGVHRDKGSVLFQTRSTGNYTFTTLLHPFASGGRRIDSSAGLAVLQIGPWWITRNENGGLLLSRESPGASYLLPAEEFIILPASAPQSRASANPVSESRELKPARVADLRMMVTVQENPLTATARANLDLALQQYSGMLTAIAGADRNPRTITPEGTAKLVPARDWTSGFFPGALWLLYADSGDPHWRAAAEKQTALLEEEQYDRTTHDLGFKLYCSYGQGLRLTGNEHYREVLLQAARTLAGRFNPTVGCIRSWDHNRSRWQFPVIIDNLMNLELLFWAACSGGDSSLYRIAMTHANTTLKNHFREDFSTWHVVNYDTTTGQVISRETHQGYSDSSTWSRGQAWALYGCTMIYRESRDERYLRQAEKIADFILNHPRLPRDGVPWWDYDAPGIPDEQRDASAGAILCSAFYELSTLAKEGERYRQAADRILGSLSSPAYRADPGANGHFLLKHSVGSKPGKTEIDVPLIYADYYFLEANLRLLALMKAGGAGAGPGVSAEAGIGKADDPLLIDLAALKGVKSRLAAEEKSLQPALKKLLREADEMMNARPLSVMDKAAVPPGGDKHDYMSLAPYWWPDPEKSDSLPWIRRDGEVNPEVNRYDKLPLRTTDVQVTTLAIAWFLSGREAYARQAARLLRVWFLDAATKMNPHLEYAQSIPGRNSGRGAGIIEGRSFFRMADAARLLAGSASWTTNEQLALEEWLGRYYRWLQESKAGREEAAAKNNHGTWYDVQAAFLALYLGDGPAARRILEKFPSERIALQIEPDGRQPRELARTRALSYSIMNLEGFFAAGILAERLGLDFWHYETPDGRSIRKALDFLMPYLSGEAKWPWSQITGIEGGMEELIALLRLAAEKYGDPRYRQAAAGLPGGIKPASRVNLLTPALP